jgi:hypothetical protein
MFTDSQESRFVQHGSSNAMRVDLDKASHDAHLDAHEEWSTVLADFRRYH